MWKTWNSANWSSKEEKNYYSAQEYEPKPRASGNLVGLIGKNSRSQPSRDRSKEHLEKLVRIDDNLLGYNLDGKICLVKCKQNESKFDVYIGMPFVKGVTERISGRTLLILGSNAHHIEAMQNQYSGVVWDKDGQKETKKYGDTIRWINVGDTQNGFIGLDYDPNSLSSAGVANTLDDVKFLAGALMEFGFDAEKRLFLLDPPYIVESSDGQYNRARGLVKLRDYAEMKII